MIREPQLLREVTDAVRSRSSGSSVALVPTMGALHEGHTSLIRQARAGTDHLVVSIFVNPLQFPEGEDLSRYPRDEAHDLTICEELGVDTVWAPTVGQMYPPGTLVPTPDPGPVGDTFEGASRPGHLAGVLTVVHRLFDVTGPCTASFGEKDAQQLFLVRRMVRKESLPVRILGCPTVRAVDGLALSSRNELLSPEERERAGCLFLGLSEAAAAARAGERDAPALVAAIAREVGATELARLDYAAVIGDATFAPVGSIEPGVAVRALVAVRFPSARLIDNLALPAPDSAT